MLHAILSLGQPLRLSSRCGGRYLLLIGLLLSLPACTLAPKRLNLAQQQISSQGTELTPTCTQPDHCAQPSPPLLQGQQAAQRSSAEAAVNTVTLLEHGEEALAARLNLIRGARHSIDVQTFIWNQDDVGQLMLDALIQAARRGVQVRILADQLFSFNDPLVLDRLARVDPHLQIKLYNPTFHKAKTNPLEFVAGITCCLVHFNQRMHNKLMIVDNVVGITGGRNYEDRYFDLDPSFDYVDRDVLVGGPVAQQMTASFEQFWRHHRSVPILALRDVNAQVLRDRAPYPSWQAPHFQHAQALARIVQESADPAWIQAHLVAPSLLTGEVAFLSDLPAKTNNPGRRHALAFTQRIMQMIAQAHFEVVLQTPYLVMSHRSRKVFSQLHQQSDPARVVISTNSLASTDAFAVYAASYKHRYRYLHNYGFEIYEMKPQHPVDGGGSMAFNLGLLPGSSGLKPGKHQTIRLASDQTGLLGLYRHHMQIPLRPSSVESADQRFGLHAKSMVIDDHLVMIGSHNLDPRSDHYNTEAGVIIDDPRLASAVRDSILSEIQPANAWVVAPRIWPTPVLGPINRQLTLVSESLPVFDVWPYRYATDYQLKPGCGPLRPDAPGFQRCYAPVGDFPAVAISAKLILTRLITALATSLNGLL